MTFDFRARRGTYRVYYVYVSIKTVYVYTVNEHEYLGPLIDVKLSWDRNTGVIKERTAMTVVHVEALTVLRRQKNTGYVLMLICICIEYLDFLIHSFISLSVVKKNKLSKIVNMSSNTAGQQQQSMSLLCQTWYSLLLVMTWNTLPLIVLMLWLFLLNNCHRHGQKKFRKG